MGLNQGRWIDPEPTGRSIDQTAAWVGGAGRGGKVRTPHFGHRAFAEEICGGDVAADDSMHLRGTGNRWPKGKKN